MPHSCCVLGCYDRGKFSLPYKHPATWKKWLKSCPYLQQYNQRQLGCKRICSKHFIPEHFDTCTNLLSEEAVPLLNLPILTNNTDNIGVSNYLDEMLTTNDNPEEVIQEETEEAIQIIEDSIDPSLYPSSIVDELTHYDTEECIPFQQLEKMEVDPLQMSPKQSPIDFDGYEESVIAYSPPLEQNSFTEPSQFVQNPENSESPSIITPLPLKVPRVVLHRLPPNLQHCRVCPPPPLATKPQPISTKQKKQNDKQTLHFNKPLRDSITYYNLKDNQKDTPPTMVVSRRLVKVGNEQLLQAYKNINSLTSYPKTRLYLKEQNLTNTFGKVLAKSQIRLTGTASKGAHYTTKEKIFALSLTKISHKGYDFLQNHLVLPSKDSIDSILNDIPLRPGINDFIFQHLADAASHKTGQEKECALLFGEMKIDKYVKFNVRTGIVEGFQDLGSGKRSSNVGDKALVFMLCGLFQIWKLPIAYYITGDLVERNNVIFEKILTEILMAIFKTGFVVKATVSDHSPINVEAINSFLADNDDSEDNIYYEIENKRLFHIYDVTNMLESLKSDSRNDDKHQKGPAKWNFLETLFQIDNDEKGDDGGYEIYTENNQMKSKAVNKSTDLEFWNSALSKLNSMKFDLQEGQTKLLPVNLFIYNVKTTKKVWEDLRSRGCAYVRRLNLKPLNSLFHKIREHEHESNINSNRFIIAYRSVLINYLTSSSSLFKHIIIQDEKLLSLLQSLTSPKKYSPYYDDIVLENIIYYVERITTGLPVVKALSSFFILNKPYKDCSQCQQSILSPQSINSAVWKSINVVDELLPEMVNILVYPLILILQQEVNTSWFTCDVHKTIFFRIMWVFVIKVRAKKWCSYFNVQKGYSKRQFFIPTK